MTALPLADRQTAVYRLFDTNDTLLYVGCSCEPNVRLANHLFKSWGPDIAAVDLDWYEDRFTALRQEAQAIVEEGPAYNIRRTPPELINPPKPVAVSALSGPHLNLEQAAEAVDIPALWLWRGLVTGKLPHSCAGDDSDEVWFAPEDIRDLRIIFDLPPTGLERERRWARASIYRACHLNRCTHAGI